MSDATDASRDAWRDPWRDAWRHPADSSVGGGGVSAGGSTPVADAMLLEGGDYLLIESGDRLLLE